MKSQMMWTLLIFLPFDDTPGHSGESSEGQEAAVAAIEQLGGQVRTAVVSVYLEGRKVDDASLVHVKNFKDVQTVKLFKTGVTDAGLEHLTGLKKLTRLQFVGTLSDAGLENLGEMTQLKILYLPSTRLVTDAGMKHLKGLTNLESLTLNRCKVTDAGLAHLKGMTKLAGLNLYDTTVSDAGLEHLKGLTNLKFLVLKRTNVTDAGVKKLQQALPNCKVSHSPRS